MINPCQGGQPNECLLDFSLITGRSHSLKYLSSLHTIRTQKSIAVSEFYMQFLSSELLQYNSRHVLSLERMRSSKNQNCISRSKKAWHTTWPDEGTPQRSYIPMTSYLSLLQNRQTPRPSDVGRNAKDFWSFFLLISHGTSLFCLWPSAEWGKYPDPRLKKPLDTR